MSQGISLGKKSVGECGRMLAAHARSLQKRYGRWSWVPAESLALDFSDPDFLADRERALHLLRLLAKPPFHLRSFRTRIGSFFRDAGELDRGLLAALRPALSAPGAAVIIETDGFSGRAEAVAAALADRKVAQVHRFVCQTADTTVEDLLESLSRIVRLQIRCGEGFRAEALPAAEPARDRDARELAARAERCPTGDWVKELDWCLLTALCRSEELLLEDRRSRRALVLRAAVERFHLYHELGGAR